MNEGIIMITKPNTVAIAAILAALATPWDACYALAVERGSGPNKGGGDKVLSQYNAFMDQCTAGKIPLNAGADLSVGEVKLPANAHASTVHRGQPAKREGRP